MKIAVIGGTGFVGSFVVEEALKRGHETTAIVRRPETVPVRPGLTAVGVDVQDPDRLGVPYDEDRLVRAFDGHDVIISCFNPGHDLRVNPNLYRDVIEGTRAIIDGMNRSDVNRIVYLGGAGSLHVPSGKMLVDDLDFFASLVANTPEGTLVPEGPPIIDIPRAARIALYLFELEKALEWTFFSPPLYMGNFDRATGRVRYGSDAMLLDENGNSALLDIRDLAFALVEEAEKAQHVRKHVTVATEPPIKM
ncbi:NAD(P)-dependent oxidoreductase [Novosphingobium sp.]|uniref:NAD(P)-dependent oxidoreductase n=1 Tax=Novosphingobium sp. TaxID=1874826 RepID=UPI002FE2712F